MARGDGSEEGLRLKAKEKVLLQLREFPVEPDAATMPFETTQKGLAEHLSLRRSHVATALQDLVRSGLVECRKGRVTGEERRLNIYSLRPVGIAAAEEVWGRVRGIEVDYESDMGTTRSTVEELVDSSKISMASAVTQLERGMLLRPEITIMTQPAKRMMTVFCPTCERHIEVDNLFVDEEVGFDCPGCGRPYRIVPGLREKTGDTYRSSVRVVAGIGVIAGAILIQFAFLFYSLPLMVAAVLLGIYLIYSSGPVKRPSSKGTRSRLSVVAASLVLGGILLISWHLVVKDIDVEDELVVFGPMALAVLLGYIGIWMVAPQGRAEFLIGVGTLVCLVAISIMFIEDFSELGVGTAPFLGVLGATMLAYSSFEEMDERTVPLAVVASVGAFMVILTFFVVWPYCEVTLHFAAAVSVVMLGAFMVSVRFLSAWAGGRRLESDLVNSVPLAAAMGMVVMAIYMVMGGAILGAVFELAVMLPFAYFGLIRVFDGEWMYKLPFTAYIVAVEVLVATAALST